MIEKILKWIEAHLEDTDASAADKRAEDEKDYYRKLAAMEQMQWWF